jgi:hypothetical protein
MAFVSLERVHSFAPPYYGEGLCWGWANPGHHFSGGIILSEIRHWQCDANHENSLWNLDAIRRTSSRLNSLAADSPARLLLVIDMASACPL